MKNKPSNILIEKCIFKSYSFLMKDEKPFIYLRHYIIYRNGNFKKRDRKSYFQRKDEKLSRHLD